MAASSEAVTLCNWARAVWNVYRCPVAKLWRRNSSGSSVSIVVLELGTIIPILDSRTESFGCADPLLSLPISGLLMIADALESTISFLFQSGRHVCTVKPQTQIRE